jgi:rod shape determining protein RodA
MSGIKAKRITLVAESDLKKKQQSYTPFVVGLFLTCLTLGLFNLYSASSGADIFYSQMKHMSLGVIVFAVAGWLVKPRHMILHAYTLFGIACALLIAVLILGTLGGGSKRWIYIGPVGGQPSELAKIAVVMVVARFFYTSKQTHPYRLRDLWPVSLMVGAIAILIFPEPDFGTAGFCVLVAAAQIAFVRLDWRSVGYIAATFTAAAPVAWNFLLKDYQKTRVLSFLNHDLDPTGKGYNAAQSLVAIGSGGIDGKGYLQGTQTQLQFLPMRHTDFVFSVFAEEHGFWGSIVLFLVFAGIAYVALEIARQAKDTFCSLVAIGLAAILLIQFTINIAMVLRMFPVVGLPLPFFSYGGSSLLTVCLAMGLLVSIDRENRGLIRNAGTLKQSR